MDEGLSASARAEQLARLLDENEQLQTSLETALEENGRLAEERDRLLQRVANFAKELRAAHLAQAATTAPPPAANAAELERHAQTQEELRVAFEELQVLTEELEVANTSLHEANVNLETRVAERSTAARESEVAFRAIANLVPDLLWQTKGQGEAIWFNDRWYAYTGIDPNTPSPKSMIESFHPDDRADVVATWISALAALKPYDGESRLRAADGSYRWFLLRAEPVFDQQGRVVHWFGAATDVQDQRMTLEALQQVEHRLSTLIEGVWQLVWRAGDQGGRTWSSPQWLAFTGQSESETHGEGWLEAVHPEDRPKALAAWADAEAKGAYDVELRLFDAAEGRHRHFRSRATPVRDREGRIVEWLGTSTDVDDIIQLQQQQTVLVAELQHRTRNLMGVVESIVRRTIESSSSLAEFQGGITDRLGTLARVQGLLSRRFGGVRVSFEALIREELAAHVAFDEDGNAAQLSIGGPANIQLFSAAVQTLALALHELATNAVKYGALSTPEGHLDVSWTRSMLDRQPSVRVVWKERGVANMPVEGDAPKGGGFGRELIERALPYQLGARTSYAFESDGVRCMIEIPVAPDPA